MTRRADDLTARHGISFSRAFWVWMKIGWLSFGGPAGQIALMHRLLVDEKKWLSDNRFLHALNYCMLLPGPEAQQLAIYLGWLLHRIRGGIVAGVLFVLPGALVILVISVLYAEYREVAMVEAVFFGVKAAVLAVVFSAVFRIGKKVLKNTFTVSIASAAFIGIFFLSIPFPWIIAAAGLAGWLGDKFIPRAPAKSADDDAEAGEDYALDRALAAGNLPHITPSLARSVKTLTLCLILWLGPVIGLVVVLGGGNVYAQEVPRR